MFVYSVSYTMPLELHAVGLHGCLKHWITVCLLMKTGDPVLHQALHRALFCFNTISALWCSYTPMCISYKYTALLDKGANAVNANVYVSNYSNM